jgi:hypothetical protein
MKANFEIADVGHMTEFTKVSSQRARKGRQLVLRGRVDEDVNNDSTGRTTMI